MSTKNPLVNQSLWKAGIKRNIFIAAALGAGLALAIACGKQDQSAQTGLTGASKKQAASVSVAQPLPQGKANFSVTMGNMDSTPWVRLGSWTFNASAGTVNGSFYSWFYNNKQNLVALNSHTCTFDGVTKTVNVYTVNNWLHPGFAADVWDGTYTYNATTGRLTIDWTSGAGAGNHEEWDVTLPDPALARVKFVSNTYNVTHGRGYGSNAPWPNGSSTNHPAAFKTIDELPTFSLGSGTPTGNTGRHVITTFDGTNHSIPTVGNWSSAAWGTVGFTTPSAPSNPHNTKHFYYTTPDTPCDPTSTNPSCSTNRPGIVYHLASRNINRNMIYVNFCACLPTNGTAANEWPGYDRNMHPHPMTQIIDDNSVMRGVIGVEVQNPPSTGPQSYGYPKYQLQLWDLTTVPGS